MQHLKDDMDDLFRDAAGNYPLQTGKPDWDRMSAALQQWPPVPPINNDRKKLRWLLLLLPLPLLCVPRFNKQFLQEKNDVASVVGSNKNKSLEGHSMDQGSVAGKTRADRQASASVDKTDARNWGRENPASDAQTVVKVHPEAGTEIQPVRIPSARNIFYPGKTNSNQQATASDNKTDARNWGRVNGTAGELRNTRINKTFSASADDQTAATANEKQVGLNTLSNAILVTAPVTETAKAGNIENTIVTAAPDTVSIKEQEATRRSVSKPKKFYMGLVAGTGLTFINGRGGADPGNDYGPMAGYEISRRLSVEASLLFSRKNYKADGDDFDQSGIYVPANSKMTKVNGYCRMMEIPLILRYELASLRKGSISIAGGVSNFMVKKESYTYTYIYYPALNQRDYKKTYEDGTQEWLASAQFSAAYALPLGRRMKLRAEPYVQLPLKGMGKGKIDMMSYGLRFGMTRSLF